MYFFMSIDVRTETNTTRYTHDCMLVCLMGLCRSMHIQASIFLMDLEGDRIGGLISQRNMITGTIFSGGRLLAFEIYWEGCTGFADKAETPLIYRVVGPRV